MLQAGKYTGLDRYGHAFIIQDNTGQEAVSHSYDQPSLIEIAPQEEESEHTSYKISPLFLNLIVTKSRFLSIARMLTSKAFRIIKKGCSQLDLKNAQNICLVVNFIGIDTFTLNVNNFNKTSMNTIHQQNKKKKRHIFQTINNTVCITSFSVLILYICT